MCMCMFDTFWFCSQFKVIYDTNWFKNILNTLCTAEVSERLGKQIVIWWCSKYIKCTILQLL